MVSPLCLRLFKRPMLDSTRYSVRRKEPFWEKRVGKVGLETAEFCAPCLLNGLLFHGLIICHAGEIRFTQIPEDLSIGTYRNDMSWSNRKTDLFIVLYRSSSAYFNVKTIFSIGTARGFRCLSNRKNVFALENAVVLRCCPIEKIVFTLYCAVLLWRCPMESYAVVGTKLYVLYCSTLTSSPP
jgi:hypothetical protein